MATPPRREPHTQTDGNVTAKTSWGRGFGNVALSVTSRDGYTHNLYLTLEEAERAVALLDNLLDMIAADGDTSSDDEE